MISVNTSSEAISSDLKRIHSSAPLIHNITNYVSMNTTANALLALGASPIMAHAPQELSEICAQARALVINIGTLSQSWIDSMVLAIQAAHARSIPIVIDPVGAGATTFRTKVARDLCSIAPPTVIRGNSSEILSLANQVHGTKGVDSTANSEMALTAAQSLASRYSCTVVISGAVDYIVETNRQSAIVNGHKIMSQVTGMGCIATACIAAFCTVNQNPFFAAIHAMAVMGIAGEWAQRRSTGPGSFMVAFLDTLANLSDHELSSYKPSSES